MNPLAPPETAPSPVNPTLRRFRIGLLLCLIAMLTFVVWEAGRVLVGLNFHVVIPGRVYRGAQPSPDDVAELVKDYGIRTVVTLRGCCALADWYQDQGRLIQELGINQEDIAFSAARLPSASEMRRLVEVLEHAEYPIYLHCRRGADRTGLAAAVVCLLQPNSTLEQARGQLGLRYGHLSFGKTGVLDRYLDLYEAWLQTQGKPHEPAHFRHWIEHEYTGGWCSARIEECIPLQLEARVGEPLGYRFRVRNTGTDAWRIRPGTTAGFHLGYVVWDEEHEQLTEGRGAHFDRTVAPGECFETTLVVPPLHRAGRFRLVVDMIEEGHCWFYQAGSEPWEEELIIRE